MKKLTAETISRCAIHRYTGDKIVIRANILPWDPDVTFWKPDDYTGTDKGVYLGESDDSGLVKCVFYSVRPRDTEVKLIQIKYTYTSYVVPEFCIKLVGELITTPFTDEVIESLKVPLRYAESIKRRIEKGTTLESLYKVIGEWLPYFSEILPEIGYPAIKVKKL